MKYAILATVLALATIAFALDGQFGIHDPSTVVLCDGKYYTYGTGGTPLVTDDGWTWRAGVSSFLLGTWPNVITSATAIACTLPTRASRRRKPPPPSPLAGTPPGERS